MRLLKHFEKLMNDPEAKGSVRAQAKANFESMKTHIEKERKVNLSAPPLGVASSAKPKKSA